jgi:hypothetical protein
MKKCPYCGYSNYDNATQCRKCDNSFEVTSGTVYKGRAYLIGPARGRRLRDRALSLIVLGLLMRVYWGGYGPWPTIDFPALVSIRVWLEPLFLYGGGALYALGLLGRFI